ncbi:hypothetical protein EXIGLDRAFT_59841 [Exidia glandulosa HHB12029]|uniref:Uncharacterized protein n=1 Tax=Exidia glandulosa HHB12029 TaxID=1314781 RepID=A0A165I5Z7_EXIGL|nr:hypothetical protein EXIGLDRAFT_59841 [Exidia glandulosa HHB12029]
MDSCRAVTCIGRKHCAHRSQPAQKRAQGSCLLVTGMLVLAAPRRVQVVPEASTYHDSWTADAGSARHLHPLPEGGTAFDVATRLLCICGAPRRVVRPYILQYLSSNGTYAYISAMVAYIHA